jgi:hypothetical protein
MPEDVHAENPTNRLSVEERRRVYAEWGVKSARIDRVETLDGLGMKRQQIEGDTGALSRLLGITSSNSSSTGEDYDDDDNMIRIMLPNGVMVACPLSLKADDITTTVANISQHQDSSSSFFISLGYKRTNGQIQVLELLYKNHNGMIQSTQASWYKPSSWISRLFRK